MKISAVYKIINTVTGDFYIGSSKNIKRRWMEHKRPSVWKRFSNNPMYLDMQKYGTDKFEFQVIEEVEIEKLKEAEQKFIEILKPTYKNANGWNMERYKEHQIEYYQQNREKYIEYYQQNREKRNDYQNKYNNQTCYYNGETLTLTALSKRFKKYGVEVEIEAKEKGASKDSINEKVIAPQKNKCSLIPLYLEYKGSMKLTSTYGQNFLDQINLETGRLYTNFNPLGTDTAKTCSNICLILILFVTLYY